MIAKTPSAARARSPVRRLLRGVLQRGFSRVDRLRYASLHIRAGDPLARGFAEFGDRSVIASPRVALVNPGAVAIGAGVEVRSHACIEALAAPGKVVLRVGDDVTVGHNVRLVAMNGIEIEPECGIGHGSTIADTMHEWTEIFEGTPPAQTPLRSGDRLLIERGAWIGNNCVIVGGITIGTRAIIAPNSVVTRDVPPKTMVSGNPARRVPYPDR